MADPITDWDDAYANGPYIPGAEAYAETWAAQAAGFRDGAGDGYRRVAYGDGARHWMDIFTPSGEPKGLAVFVHGGYWMKFDAGLWSHLAAGAVARGWAAVLPSYTLAPAAQIADITGEITRAIEAAAARVAGPIALAGHSAGGHLVTRQISGGSGLSDATRQRIVHVLSISGVHDLRPLLATKLNETLGLGAESAAAESPALLWPQTDARVTCWVGAAERPEFRRQSALLAMIWAGAGLDISLVEVPERHHFDVIDPLSDPESAMVARWLG